MQRDPARILPSDRMTCHNSPSLCKDPGLQSRPSGGSRTRQQQLADNYLRQVDPVAACPHGEVELLEKRCRGGMDALPRARRQQRDECAGQSFLW